MRYVDRKNNRDGKLRILWCIGRHGILLLICLIASMQVVIAFRWAQSIVCVLIGYVVLITSQI